MRHLVRLIWVIAWVVFLTLPIGFFFGADEGSLQGDWLAGLHTALVQLAGEQGARWVFSGLWLALNLALFWRLVLKRTHDDLGDPPNLDD